MGGTPTHKRQEWHALPAEPARHPEPTSLICNNEALSSWMKPLLLVCQFTLVFALKCMSSRHKLGNFKQMQANDFHYSQAFLNYKNIFTTRNNVVGPLDSFSMKAETKYVIWDIWENYFKSAFWSLAVTSSFIYQATTFSLRFIPATFKNVSESLWKEYICIHRLPKIKPVKGSREINVTEHLVINVHLSLSPG